MLRTAIDEARASEARWAKGEPIGPLDGAPVTVKDNIATKGEPKPVGTAAEDLSPQRGRAAGGALARGGRDDLHQDDHAGLRHALLGPVEHPPARPQSVEARPQSGRIVRGRGRGGGRALWPAARWNRIGGSVRLPAGWCGIFTLKPSAGRIPIDPPYIGRVAGPMTRTVSDAALMMETLSLPDVRDYASLKYEKLDWTIEPAPLRGLRIGLLAEAGCGAAPAPEVKAAVERAARDFEASGAHVEPLKPFLTQEMLDGLDRFWRTRALIDLRALSPAKRAKVLPFIREWAESASGLSGEQVFHGFSQIPAMRQAAIEATTVRPHPVADRAHDRVSRRMGLAQPGSAEPVSAYRFHRRLQHVRAAGGVNQLRL